MTPGGERSRFGGRSCRSRPGGKGLGGYGLGGLVWVWAGLAWARYFALSLPTAAAAAAAGEASAARAGFFPRLRGVPGAAAPLAPSALSFAAAAAADEAPVAAVADSRTSFSVFAAAAAAVGRGAHGPCRARRNPLAPCLLSCAAAAALGDASGSCAGAAPLPAVCRGPRPGPRRGSPGSPPPARQGGAGRRGWPLGRRGGRLGWPRFPGRRRRSDHRRLRQPPLLALREGLPRPLWGGDGGAGAGPAVVAVVPPEGPIGVCHYCHSGRHAWWQARPSHYLLVHQCRAVGSAVWCSAGGGGGGGWGAGCGVSPARPGVRGHPPALGGEAGEPRGPRVAPQLPVWDGAQGPGPPGVVERCRGQPHQMDPRNGGDLLCAQEGVYSVPRRGRREGGRGTGVAP